MTQPARTSAQPCLRLLTPPSQFFAETLSIGAAAYAFSSDGHAEGIAAIRFHFEGSTLEVTSPSFRQLERADGSSYDCLGYWADLARSGQDGDAQLFIEAIAQDAAMQSRLSGPYLFGLRAQLHDYELSVGSAGDFLTITAALDYLRANDAQNPLITLLDAGDYIIADDGPAHIGQGYCRIRPADRQAQARITLGQGAANRWRPKYDRLWFENVMFDLDTIESIYNEGNGDHVFSRCRFERTGGRALWFKNLPASSYMIRNHPWLLENTMIGAYEPGDGASLLRGNIARAGWGDFAGNAACSVYNKVDDWAWKDIASDTRDRLRIAYSGPGTNITLAREKLGKGTSAYTAFTLKVDGAAVLTHTTWDRWTRKDDPAHGYEVADFAAAINALPGFAAQILEDGNAIAAHALNLQGSTTNSDFPDTSIGSDYALVCDLDLHTDAFQNSTGTNSNVIIAFNTITNFEGQLGIFGSSTTRDLAIIGNIFDRGEDALANNQTQFDSGTFEHALIVNNSWRGQGVNLASDSDFDGFSLISANVVPVIVGSAFGVSGSGNLVASGAQSHPNLTGTIQAGDESSWYLDADGLDFTPTGALLDNQVARGVASDLTGAQRQAIDAPGALAAP